MDKDNKHYKYAKSLAIRWKNSKKKIIEKLKSKEVTNDEIDKIIDSLEKDNLIDEKESFDKEVFILEQKHYGYQRIKETLILKGYERQYIDQYFYVREIDKDNCSYYLKKVIKKYPNYKYFDGERKKLFSYLKRYGFNDKMIEEVLKEVNIDENAT